MSSVERRYDWSLQHIPESALRAFRMKGLASQLAELSGEVIEPAPVYEPTGRFPCGRGKLLSPAYLGCTPQRLKHLIGLNAASDQPVPLSANNLMGPGSWCPALAGAIASARIRTSPPTRMTWNSLAPNSVGTPRQPGADLTDVAAVNSPHHLSLGAACMASAHYRGSDTWALCRSKTVNRPNGVGVSSTPYSVTALPISSPPRKTDIV